MFWSNPPQIPSPVDPPLFPHTFPFWFKAFFLSFFLYSCWVPFHASCMLLRACIPEENWVSISTVVQFLIILTENSSLAAVPWPWTCLSGSMWDPIAKHSLLLLDYRAVLQGGDHERCLRAPESWTRDCHPQHHSAYLDMTMVSHNFLTISYSPLVTEGDTVLSWWNSVWGARRGEGS